MQKQRMTRQRKIILEEIQMLRVHPTAEAIYESVRKKLPRISMGTVYRNLDMLVSSGLIRKLDPGMPQMRFDGNLDDHYHFICSRCGKIEDIPAEPLQDKLKELEKSLGRITRYGIFGHRLEFVGLCKDCEDD